MNHTIQELIDHITSECTKVDREAAFDAMLDEVYSFEKVGGPFEYMSPSRVLQECDPTAYRCGVNDWADSEPWSEVDGDTYADEDIEKAREEFLDSMKEELSELESEREEAEELEDTDGEKDLASKVTALETFIDLCERHAFN